MARRHFLIVDAVTGFVWGDWETDYPESVLPTPTPEAGRSMVDVSVLRLRLGEHTGHTRNPDGTFTTPAVQRTVAVDAFFELFSQAERIAIRQKARGNDLATPLVAPDDVIADLVHQIDLKVGQRINLESPKLAAALTLLVSKGVITTERQAQILAGTVPA